MWTRTESKLMRRIALVHYLLEDFLDDLLSQGYSKEELSAGVQKFTESQVIEYLSKQYSDFKITPNRLALAGGVVANVKLNQRILDCFKLTDLFVHPAMDDAGTALGSAVLYSQSFETTKYHFSRPFQDLVYLGRHSDRCDNLYELCQDLNLVSEPGI
jgi:carbamoyltransferase